MPSTIVKSNQWQEITEDFLSSADKLNLGELINSEHFTLFEGMSAIELMDPKMDSGMLYNKIKLVRKILNFDQSVKEGKIKISNLLLEELIGIIDDSFGCLVTWLDGYLLGQTVMTNLYLHHPEKIEDPCLKTFSQAILKIVDYIDTLVHSIYCIEEEDFQLNVKRFPLETHTTDQKILNSFEDLLSQYEKLLLSSIPKQQQQQQPSTTAIHEPKICDNRPLSAEIKSKIDALTTRLKFTFEFYKCFRVISKNMNELSLIYQVGQQNQASQMQQQLQQNEQQATQQNNKTIKLIQSITTACESSLTKCFTYLERWNETIDMGIKPLTTSTISAESNEKIQPEFDYPTIMGFEPLVNHRMNPPVYPRCPIIKSRPKTIIFLKDLVTRLKNAISTYQTASNQKSFIDILEVLETFSKYSKPKSCVVSRSFVQLLYEPIRSNRSIKSLIVHSMNEFCEPLLQSLKKDDTKLPAFNDYLTDCSQAFIQGIFIYGHNPARQHEKLQDLISSLKNLQYSGFLINSAFNNSLIYTWTTYYLAYFCTKYILAGLELEIFSTYEYPYIFWYLYDILYRNKRDQIETAKNELSKQEIHDCKDSSCSHNSSITNSNIKSNKSTNCGNNNVTNNHNNNNNNIKSKKQKKKEKKIYDKSWHEKKMLVIDGYRFLTGGLFVLTFGLKQQGKIKTPSMIYTTEEICFDHRFGALTGASVYESYKKTISRLEKSNLEFIYKEASECFHEAKEIFTRIGDHEGCLKVCKTNLVFARILCSSLDTFSNRDVEFSFETHPSFPTVGLKQNHN